MASRHNRRRSGSRRKRSGAPGWLLLVIGLLAGAAGLAAYDLVRDRLAAPAADDSGTTAAPAAKPAPPARAARQPAPAEKRFEFYEMLPNSEVLVPGEDRDVRRDISRAPVAVPGVYVLQAGAFGSFAEADKLKAQLALLGISSQIQKIMVDERQYHRVRIGPIDDLDELNRTRTRLREAKIEALVIRTGE
ncbi:MAG: SPOR domain-containing protein [Gammaproteobacteria bacterium]|nr:SPOR domain-containing protein [Gammaproteobacteria bacterium]